MFLPSSDSSYTTAKKLHKVSLDQCLFHGSILVSSCYITSSDDDDKAALQLLTESDELRVAAQQLVAD